MLLSFVPFLSAQVDTTQAAAPSPAQPVFVDTTIGRTEAIPTDIPVLGPKKRKGLGAAWHTVKTGLNKYKPEIYEQEGDLKLKLKFPWREPIVLPYLKGLKRIKHPPPPYDPEIAWQRSALIPGWGQAYNRAYWKIPLFYAGYAAGAGFISYTHQQYLRFRTAYLGEVDDDPTTGDPVLSLTYDANGLRRQRENFRKYRDYGIIALVGWHVLHVAEAYVDAHMKGFDVSDDLSMRVGPGMLNTALPGWGTPINPTLRITISF